jgi:hypothetical protein
VNEKAFEAFGLGGTTLGAAATTAAPTLTTAAPQDTTKQVPQPLRRSGPTPTFQKRLQQAIDNEIGGSKITGSTRTSISGSANSPTLGTGGSFGSNNAGSHGTIIGSRGAATTSNSSGDKVTPTTQELHFRLCQSGGNPVIGASRMRRLQGLVHVSCGGTDGVEYVEAESHAVA